MAIDWDLAAKIVLPLVTLVLGKSWDSWAAKRPRLISYLGHVSSFTLNDEAKSKVHTHAIVIRNAGRSAANNVRIGHNMLPDVQVYPAVPYKVEPTPGGGVEIVFDKLIPGEQVTIAYLYFPPVLWNQINAYSKSDEGFAKILNVIPSPQPTKFTLWINRVLLFVGATTVLYLCVLVAGWAFR